MLVEQFIPGRELTVAVLGDEALPIVEIRPKSGHYDYESKYTAGRSEYFCPADLPEPLAARVRELGVARGAVLGCRGVSRVDFRLEPDGEPYCLEVNTDSRHDADQPGADGGEGARSVLRPAGAAHARSGARGRAGAARAPSRSAPDPRHLKENPWIAPRRSSRNWSRAHGAPGFESERRAR